MAEVIQQSRYHFGDNRRYMVMIHIFMTFYRLDLTSPKNKIFRGESKTINVNANVTGWHKNKELMKVSELFFYSKIVETIDNTTIMDNYKVETTQYIVYYYQHSTHRTLLLFERRKIVDLKVVWYNCFEWYLNRNSVVYYT
jgi:hypothetical protein